MNLIEANKNLLEQFSNNSTIDAIIIFGSYASNRIKPMSDLDIAILFQKNTSEKDRDNVLSYSDETLDIVDFSNMPLSLQFKIITQGKILKSNKNLKSLKYKITNQWFDFKPRLQRHYKKRGLLIQ